MIEDKIKTTVICIGFEERAKKMYPHTLDFIINLENYFDEVIYLHTNNMRVYSKLYPLDEKLLSILKSNDYFEIKINFRVLIESLFKFKMEAKKLLNDLRQVKTANEEVIIIAIDELAYYFANKLYKNKVILYSHDFIAIDNKRFFKGLFSHSFLDDFKKSIQNCRAIIIQDENRKRLIESIYKNQFKNTIYLPISLNDSAYCKKEAEKRRTNKKNLLRVVQSGFIASERKSNDLLMSYQKWDNKYSLCFRGYISGDIKKSLNEVKRKPVIDTKLCSNEKMPKVITKHDVGFIGYTKIDCNFKYLENASGQLIEYLRLGIPVITFGLKEFNKFVNQQEIGVGINDIDKIEEALKDIQTNYKKYSENARCLFEEKFNLQNNFKNNFITSLVECNKKEMGNRADFETKNNKQFNEKNIYDYGLLKRIMLKLIVLLFNPFSKKSISNWLTEKIYKIDKEINKNKNKKYLKKVKKVAIFGTSITAEDYCDKLLNLDIKVEFFIDNSKEKQGKLFKGKSVYSVEHLMDQESSKIDAIVLASAGRKNEMKKQLKNIGFNKKTIDFIE